MIVLISIGKLIKIEPNEKIMFRFWQDANEKNNIYIICYAYMTCLSMLTNEPNFNGIFINALRNNTIMFLRSLFSFTPKNINDYIQMIQDIEIPPFKKFGIEYISTAIKEMQDSKQKQKIIKKLIDQEI